MHDLVEHKYEYLLASLDAADNVEPIRSLLLERERLRTSTDVHDELSSEVSAAAPSRVQPLIDQLDRQLAALLPAENLERYELLKAADIELMQLAEFESGIREFAPLDGAQREALAFTKLRLKRQFETLLARSGLDRDYLSSEERAHAHRIAGEALAYYRDQYLYEASQFLSDEQFAALHGFETSEFDRTLRRVQLSINSK